jgi:hypothetical protein
LAAARRMLRFMGAPVPYPIIKKQG